ncbi:polyketide cyclase/dehydrase/lipid transport protein [Paraburkholderia caballeronis]|uniref:SRPBCC family protein n=1 Tax=Paraburkholderia caballeronis TaxID=416943 RepID=UPI0010E0E47D|nr:SRPBCC family protein [Paraburkholderia caballeronis]TDV39258.1 polyketide cyclase/dehydrase/lipid transport protein [Paraburkholderia caballeronis]
MNKLAVCLSFALVCAFPRAAALAQSVSSRPYHSPIPDSMNVRFVENRIVIQRPARAVFDWVTTWGNLPRWLPVAHGVAVVRGKLDAPSQLGDVLIENVNPANTSGISKQYTVVAQIDGFLWTVAGQDVVNGKPGDRIQYVATFAVTPIGPDSCLFTRLFQTVRPDEVNPVERRAVDDPEIIQKGLVRLKSAVESAIPSDERG